MSELAAIYDERGARQKYLDFLVQLVAKEPGSYREHLQLGEEYRAQHKYDQAIDALKQAASLNQRRVTHMPTSQRSITNAGNNRSISTFCFSWSRKSPILSTPASNSAMSTGWSANSTRPSTP